jgi:hypothetical protein
MAGTVMSRFSRLQARAWKAAAVVPILLAVACGGDAQDPHDRVGQYERGQLESDLLRTVGPPTHVRSVDASRAGETCSPSDLRELSYEVPSRGLGKRARDLLGIGPSQIYVVCVGGNGRITRIAIVDVN